MSGIRIRLGMAGLLVTVTLGMVTAPVVQAGTAPCHVRNVTQATHGPSFRAIVDAAHRGDRLTIKGVCAINVRIEKDLSIRGVGSHRAVLDGNGRGRVLRIERGARVVLRHLVISHGSPLSSTMWRGAGGGIRNRGALIVVDTWFRFNFAFIGAGISNDGSLVLRRSRIIGDPETQLQGWGGGLANRGAARVVGSLVTGHSTDYHGAGIWNSGTMTIERSRVTGNASSQQGPGGVHNEGTLRLLDSVVTSNSGVEGGGIGNQGFLVLVRSLVTHNGSDTPGGGILNLAGGVVRLRDGSSVTGNTGNRYAIGEVGGGGIDNAGELALRDSSVIGNEALGPDVTGGGIHNHPGATVKLWGNASVTGNAPDDCYGTTAC